MREQLDRRAFLGKTALTVSGLITFPVNTMGAAFSPPPLKAENTLLKLPEDIVDPELLAENFGTTIFDLPNLKFNIRETALIREPALIWMGNKAKEGQKLYIMLIDGPGVSMDFMNDKQKSVFNRPAKLIFEDALIRSGQNFYADSKMLLDSKNDYLQKKALLDELYYQKSLDLQSYDKARASLFATYQPVLEYPRREHIIYAGGFKTKGFALTTLDNKIIIGTAAGTIPKEEQDIFPQKYVYNLDFRLNFNSEHYLTPEEYIQSIEERRSLNTPGIICHEFGHLVWGTRGNLERDDDDKTANNQARKRLIEATRLMLETGSNRLHYFFFASSDGVCYA